MEKLNFDVYIGSKTFASDQGANIKAVVVPRFHIPHGRFMVNGSPQTFGGAEGFDRLYDLGTYFADWLDDFVDDYDLISANIYLNVKSLHKRFTGKNIVEFIDKLDKIPNYENIRNFKEID